MFCGDVRKRRLSNAQEESDVLEGLGKEGPQNDL